MNPEQPAANSQPIPTPTQSECMAFVSFARYTSLAADRLAGALLNMTTKLEDQGILKVDRPSRLKRDKKLRKFGMNIQKTDAEIKDMMKLIPNHPDSEQLVRSIFMGIKDFYMPNSKENNPKDSTLEQNLTEIAPNPEVTENSNQTTDENNTDTTK